MATIIILLKVLFKQLSVLFIFESVVAIFIQLLIEHEHDHRAIVFG